VSDIGELFARDPLELSKENIGEIIKYYREKRAQFNLGDKTAGSTKKMKQVEPKIKASAEELELGWASA
jgi:hypothetical protein